MLNKIFKQDKNAGEKLEFKIDGMHCSSCAMNIDFALEDLDGVKESKTNFASSRLVVLFDPSKVNVDKIKKEVKKQGYKIS